LRAIEERERAGTAGTRGGFLGPARLLPFCLIPLGGGVAPIAFGDSVIAWHAGIAMLGATFGMNNTLWATLLPHSCGTRHLGSILAFVTTAMALATAVGPGITGP
jgi:hypothetical protein